MTYLAGTLIDRAWYTSGIVAKQLQTVSGDQASDGLWLLNELLAMKFTAESRLVPYFQAYEGVFTPGQEKFFIPGLIEADTMTFVINTVRYAVIKMSRKRYFGSSRANGISSLVYSYRMERTFGGTNMYVYFLPQANWSFEIWGKFGLTDVTVETDLSLVYDEAYIGYLRNALAEYYCEYYQQVCPPDVKERVKMFKKELATTSVPDVSVQKVSNLGTGQSLNYAAVNLGRGWSRPY
jgi:hypothetical protein